MAEVIWKVPKRDFKRVTQTLWLALKADRDRDAVKLGLLQEEIRMLPGYPWHKADDDTIVVVEG